MKNLLTSRFGIIYHLFLIAVGVIIGKIYNFPHFEISKQIDLVDILSILITVWLAIAITTIFDKKINDQRVEKDIVLRRVENVYIITSDLQKESISGKIHYTEAAASVKRINTAMQSIYKTIEKCQFEIKDDIKENIRSAIGDLRDILTDTPKVNEEEIRNHDIPIEVKDGIIHYNRQRIVQIEAKFDLIKDFLLELEIRINKQ